METSHLCTKSEIACRRQMYPKMFQFRIKIKDFKYKNKKVLNVTILLINNMAITH
jgi:hypothetical protein